MAKSHLEQALLAAYRVEAARISYHVEMVRRSWLIGRVVEHEVQRLCRTHGSIYQSEVVARFADQFQISAPKVSRCRRLYRFLDRPEIMGSTPFPLTDHAGELLSRRSVEALWPVLKDELAKRSELPVNNTLVTSTIAKQLIEEVRRRLSGQEIQPDHVV